MARVIAVTNQKGGVAKSTTAEAFAAGLERRGYKVLLVDLDSQPGSLSLHVKADISLPGTRELMAQRKPVYQQAVECIQDTSSFGAVIASDVTLGLDDHSLDSRVGREFVLDKRLSLLGDDFDYIIVDTPPALGVRTINALCAADDIIIPTKADYSSFAGLIEIQQGIEDVLEITMHDLRVAGVVICDYYQNTRLGETVSENTEEFCRAWGVPLFKTKVRHTVKVSEAQRLGETIFDHAENATAAADYNAVIDEYLTNVNI